MIRIAARGSDLARAQAEEVAAALRGAHPGLETFIETFTTRGDRSTDPLPQLGGTGLFTAEIDRALREGLADLAVHSHKDLPIESPKDLRIAAVPARGPVADVLVSRNGKGLAALPGGAAVGTSSPRRAAWVRREREDLRVVDLRGNVPTRLERVRSGELDACILALAGLVRLGAAERVTETLPRLLPAPGQGALAVAARAGSEAGAMADVLDDAETRLAVNAERAVLAGLGGGCSVPLGAHAARENGTWRVRAMLFGAGGEGPWEDERTGQDPLALAAEIARALGARSVPS